MISILSRAFEVEKIYEMQLILNHLSGTFDVKSLVNINILLVVRHVIQKSKFLT